MSSRPVRWLVAALVAAAALPSSARADTIDLTTAGSFAYVGGVGFYTADPKPTGTGYIDPFVRIQGSPTERGYNTDARPVEFETKDQNQWTHSLPLNTLGSVEINGAMYYKFMLDINESKNGPNSLLSMNDFRLYLGNSPSLTGFNDGFGGNSVKVYDVDSLSDNTFTLNYALDHGSGSGDLNVFVPVSAFQGHDGFDFVYLYSSFGNPYSSNSGFEEWAAQTGQPVSSVPAPPALVLAGMGFGGLALGRLRLRRKA
jgi:hypothetical protein